MKQPEGGLPVAAERLAGDSPPARFGVAGDPVEHSRSPQIHNAAYAALGLAADYQRLPLPPPLFDETVRALPASGFHGINVTIPHKRAALLMADESTPAAAAIGAANTLSFAEGRILAANTDAPGMIAAIDSDLDGASVLVLGAGGTARAAIWAAVAAGATVTVWNRTAQRAEALAAEFGATAVPEPRARLGDADVVVNATAAGMSRDETLSDVLGALRLDLDELRADAILVDFVYRQGRSELSAAALDRGLTVIEGPELLVRQAALSFEIWFQRPAPLAAMRAALE